MKFLALIATFTLASAAQATEFPSWKDIAYLGSDREEKMDVYQPPQGFARPAPAVIWIHGGAWDHGDKGEARGRTICETFAANGYVAFSINYRLYKGAAAGDRTPGEDAEASPAASPAASRNPTAPAAVPAWPQNFYDCKSALRYIRKESARLGIDPDRIAVTGGSAGGHLALLTGLTAGRAELNSGGLYTDQSNKVTCIIDLYGVTEITGGWIKRFAGATPEETRANVHAASALNYLTKDAPPVLIVHGTADKTVNIAVSRHLAAEWQRLGSPCQFIEVPGAGHAFALQPKEMDLRPAVLDFLGKYLGKPIKSP